eukprot:TRINITY_DN26804_c0_g2_i2.p1 TRINITY_DN26804_c0_g2~~TRINITY_DN26804_c0_g2_i2.p1  ORF type:complete len:955 (-),score=107.63 TRINITY_DN26804_c0_g2_i2:20-2884(-)
MMVLSSLLVAVLFFCSQDDVSCRVQKSDTIPAIREVSADCFYKTEHFSYCCGYQKEGGRPECFQSVEFRDAGYDRCCLGRHLDDERLNAIYSRYFLRSMVWSTDISHHMHTLRVFASQCDSVTEVGVRSGMSSWALLQGLADRGKRGSLTSIDLDAFTEAPLLKRLASNIGIDYSFTQGNVLDVTIGPTCLLFLDTFHAYPQLKRELEKATHVSHYIVLHDTTLDGDASECVRKPDVPGHSCSDMSKASGFNMRDIERGLWPAVTEFLEAHSYWQLHQRYWYNNGLIVLRRDPALEPASASAMIGAGMAGTPAVATAAFAMGPYADLLIRGLTYELYVDKLADDYTGSSTWPRHALAMSGTEALWNLANLLLRVQARSVAGDFVETGIWRGASGILARKIWDALGESSRAVWGLDSFQWLPPPDPAYPKDRGDRHHAQPRKHSVLTENAGWDAVRASYRRFGINVDDDAQRTHLVKGWFNETVPRVAHNISSIAVLLLDGDMYQSTWEALIGLYDRVSLGGFVVVDDWSLGGCRKAIDDFRDCIGATEPMLFFRAAGYVKAYWQKQVSVDKDQSPCYASCSIGIRSGSRCCPTECGKCGGPGCDARPGGGAACCAGSISRRCHSEVLGPPPCVLGRPAPSHAAQLDQVARHTHASAREKGLKVLVAVLHCCGHVHHTNSLLKNLHDLGHDQIAEIVIFEDLGAAQVPDFPNATDRYGVYHAWDGPHGITHMWNMAFRFWKFERPWVDVLLLSNNDVLYAPGCLASFQRAFAKQRTINGEAYALGPLCYGDGCGYARHAAQNIEHSFSAWADGPGRAQLAGLPGTLASVQAAVDSREVRSTVGLGADSVIPSVLVGDSPEVRHERATGRSNQRILGFSWAFSREIIGSGVEHSEGDFLDPHNANVGQEEALFASNRLQAMVNTRCFAHRFKGVTLGGTDGSLRERDNLTIVHGIS